MKRYVKIMFGRLSMVGLAIIAQVLLLLLLFSVLSDYYVPVQVVLTVLDIVVLLSVVNRDMTPEAKIPWLIVILLLPVFGTVLYLLFAGNKLNRKQKKEMKQVREESSRFEIKNPSTEEFLLSNNSYFYGQCEYIHRTTGLIAYQNTDVTYYPNGETYLVALLEALDRAEKYIFMETFIIEPGKMWGQVLDRLIQKVKQGVEVRLMYDDIGSIGKVPNEYANMLCDVGILCVKFNPFRPVISEVHNNRDHRKIVVIDGQVGFAGGTNFADEYINETHPFGYWKDTVLRLQGEGVRGLTLLFLQNYDIQTNTKESYALYLNVPVLPAVTPGAVVPFGDGPRPQYQEYIAENILLNMICQAKHSIWITTPYLIIDGQLKTALCSAAMRGVDVRIVTPGIPDKKIVYFITRSNYEKLQECGVKIYEYTPGFLHAKQYLCDGEIGMVGSINLDYRSLVHHFECGVLLYRCTCLEEIKQDFEELFRISQNKEGFHQNLFATLFCRLGAAFSPLM